MFVLFFPSNAIIFLLSGAKKACAKKTSRQKSPRQKNPRQINPRQKSPRQKSREPFLDARRLKTLGFSKMLCERKLARIHKRTK
jgi:hypothetical protein